MINTLAYTLAGDEYYAPLASAADPGPRYCPTQVPPGRQGAARDLWTMWSHPDAPRVPQGWKIHVSARLERAPRVLDTVAEICFARQVPFKHLSTRLFFLIAHHKHALRAQAGKFCAIYPPDTETARRLLETLAAAATAAISASLLGKCRCTVPGPTPACPAISSSETVRPSVANSVPAASRIRSRLRRASARSGRWGGPGRSSWAVRPAHPRPTPRQPHRLRPRAARRGAAEPRRRLASGERRGDRDARRRMNDAIPGTREEATSKGRAVRTTRRSLI